LRLEFTVQFFMSQPVCVR